MANRQIPLLKSHIAKHQKKQIGLLELIYILQTLMKMIMHHYSETKKM